MAENVSHIDMSIEEYLRGNVGYQIADNALNSILFKRKIAAGAMASTLSDKQLDLCTADLYGVQLLRALKTIRKIVTEAGSTLKVVGKLLPTIKENCERWRENCMRNGERIYRVRVK